MKILVIWLMLLSSYAYASETIVLIKSGLSTTGVENNLRIAAEYRNVTNPDNLFEGQFIAEAAKSKNEYNTSMKLGLCLGYEYKICPIYGLTQEFVKNKTWETDVAFSLNLDLLIMPTKWPWLVSGFEITNRVNVFDFNAMTGIRF